MEMCELVNIIFEFKANEGTLKLYPDILTVHTTLCLIQKEITASYLSVTNTISKH